MNAKPKTYLKKLSRVEKEMQILTHIHINTESLVKSFLKDTYSFGMLVLVLWINYKFLGNKAVVDFIVAMLLVAYLLKPAEPDQRHFYNISQEKIERIKEILREK